MQLSTLCDKTIRDISGMKIDRVHVLLTGDTADALVCYLLLQCELAQVSGHIIPWYQSVEEQEMAVDVQTALTDGGEFISNKETVENLLAKLDMVNANGQIEPQEILRAHKIAKRCSVMYLSGLCKDSELIIGSIDKTRRILGLSIPEEELLYNPIKHLRRSEVYQIIRELATTLSDSLYIAKSIFKRLLLTPRYEDNLLLNMVFNKDQRTAIQFGQLLETTDKYIDHALNKEPTNTIITSLVAERINLMKRRSL